MVISVVVLAACRALAGLDAYQAITGRRVSKRPSQRSDQQMRRQSAMAAIVLTVAAAALLTIMLPSA